VHEAFVDYRLDAAEVSGPALRILRKILAGERVDQASSELSPREWRELSTLLGVAL
jgi:thymidylate synthase (FAD)